MESTKMFLGDDFEDPFELIGIHCSEESYKLAYFLNRHTELRFKRSRQDIDIQVGDRVYLHAVFTFEDRENDFRCFLVENKSYVQANPEALCEHKTSLFSETLRAHYLLSEFKKIDYFIKIESDLGHPSLTALLSDINAIRQIVSAYIIDTAKLKSKHNLIFDLC